MALPGRLVIVILCCFSCNHYRLEIHNTQRGRTGIGQGRSGLGEGRSSLAAAEAALVKAEAALAEAEASLAEAEAALAEAGAALAEAGAAFARAASHAPRGVMLLPTTMGEELWKGEDSYTPQLPIQPYEGLPTPVSIQSHRRPDLRQGVHVAFA